MKAFTFHTDPGHGWLEVHVKDLTKAGLAPGDFSGYSYIDGSVVYLEEDLDATIFLKSWEANVGAVEVHERYYATDHWIRGLDRIAPTTIDDEIWF